MTLLGCYTLDWSNGHDSSCISAPTNFSIASPTYLQQLPYSPKNSIYSGDSLVPLHPPPPSLPVAPSASIIASLSSITPICYNSQEPLPTSFSTVVDETAVTIDKPFRMSRSCFVTQKTLLTHAWSNASSIFLLNVTEVIDKVMIVGKIMFDFRPRKEH